MLRLAATTVVVVGGNGDPDGTQQWDRIKAGHTGADPILIHYPADVGVGLPGYWPMSLAGRDTYAGSLTHGASAVAAAIADAQHDGDVVIYAISLGTDVVGVALARMGSDAVAPGKGTISVVASGSPSFVGSGIWNRIPPLVPGLRNGPVPQGGGTSGAEIVSICIKGDVICGSSANPLVTAFYFLPGFSLHGKDYSAQVIGRYSPVDGSLAFVPGAVGVAPMSTTTETKGGRILTVATYADGTVKRSWVEDGTTWVVIDTGENPWAHLLRSYGIPMPKNVDDILNRLAPVPEPGVQRTTLTSIVTGLVTAAGDHASTQGGSPTAAAAQEPVKAAVVQPGSHTGDDTPTAGGVHAADRPGGVPVADILARSDAETTDAETTPRPGGATAAVVSVESPAAAEQSSGEPPASSSGTSPVDAADGSGAGERPDTDEVSSTSSAAVIPDAA